MVIYYNHLRTRILVQQFSIIHCVAPLFTA